MAAAIGLALASPACGKKAPLRLTDDRTAERAPAARARIREGLLTLDFRVPAHRFFPEREEPWVLARILRQDPPSSEIVEVGAILEAQGFAFDSPLNWTDQVPPQKSSFLYRVEFRDAARRRRALSPALAVSAIQPPGTPSDLTAAGHLRSIVLKWTAPPGDGSGIMYRIYRRERSQEAFAQAGADPVEGTGYVDSRIESGRDYCYAVRAVLNATTVAIEGPASPESCARAATEALPPAQPPAP